MILANGIVHPAEAQAAILAELPRKLCDTLAAGAPDPEAVIHVLDTMGRRILNGDFDTWITVPELRAQLAQAGRSLERDVLQRKLETELGGMPDRPSNGLSPAVRRMPLGVLLHIAAGNLDALPAWSVIEGLLAGNINLLKLPQADSGLTIAFFRELISMEPKLRDFIYVFDTPSTDPEGMQMLADCADGIAVWGGDAAVSALRRMAKPGCRLIEWGHKLGFCYLSGDPPEEVLRDLAVHIISTRQLLCSSCQVIYLDTDSTAEITVFARRFLPVLEKAADRFPVRELRAKAELTLRRYTAELEQAMGTATSQCFLPGRGCSITVCADNALELSPMYGSVLVKALPQDQIIPVLREKKGYLQTAGLWCPDELREKLTERLLRSGVCRVLPPGRMSEAFPGEAHDGSYALAQYSRITNIL